MQVLLDTHVWIWYIVGDSRLRSKLIKLISDPETDLWLSPFSIWEAVMLGETNRVIMNDEPHRWINKQLAMLEVREPVFSAKTAMLSRTLEFKHNDPIDRFLAATAYDQKLTLATADANLIGLSWLESFS